MKKSMLILLYGSYARGEADEYSDIDILIINNKLLNLDKQHLPLGHYHKNDKISISQYTWHEIQNMANFGSLFLYHLKFEAKIIFGSNDVKKKLSNILNSLQPYQRAKKDFTAFNLVVNDVEESVTSGGSLIYELSVLGTVLRHASILGCFIIGCPSFGRTKPIEILVKLCGLEDIIYHEYSDLYNFRLFNQRQNCNIITNKSIDYVIEWCVKIRKILLKLEEKIDAYERKLLNTN